MDQLDNYYGRLFTSQQLNDDFKKLANQKASMSMQNKLLFCNRCNSGILKENQLPNGSYYCRKCIIFGRIESKDPLYYFPPGQFTKTKSLKWRGSLTQYQEEISTKLVSNYEKKKKTLVHAVTGAGKTEMIYQLISKVLDSGGWVCLASPRTDVCIEIHKRLARDFSVDVTLMHAGSESYKRSQLIVATTHQLLKFYRAFDLLIIDEVDSFPFVNNHMLNWGLKQSLSEKGHLVLLTATSTKDLEKEVAKGLCEKVTLSRRFHNQPLVVPEFQLVFSFLSHIEKGKLPKKFLSIFAQQRKTGFPLLIFFPIIEKGELFSRLLASHFPHEAIGYVSSQSHNRTDIVEMFRNESLSILVTTTILERGVTFPGIDVFVVLANHPLFNWSSLIQISGRVGRAVQRPTGQLLFIHEGISFAMLKARNEIRRMNKEAYGK